MSIEDRKHERVSTRFIVRVTFGAGDRALEARCLNLSEGGLFLQMDHPPPKGMNITLALHLESIDRTVHLKGVVTWTRPEMPDPQFSPGAGIRFDSLSVETRDLIRCAIAERRNQLSESVGLQEPR